MPTRSSAAVSTARYNPRVARWVIRLVSRISRSGLSDFIYLFTGAPIVVAFYVGGFFRHDITVLGQEHIPPKGTGFFLLSNHQGLAEAPALGTWLYPRGIWYPSKAEFYRGWLSAFIFLTGSAWRSFPVRRGEKDADAVGLMEELLKKGDSVLLFPEGTRSHSGDLLPGKIGVGMIIHSARPSVLPVYVEGFDRIWPARGKGYLNPLRVKRGQRALIQFGPLMDLSRHWDKPFGRQAGREIVDEVMAELARLKEEAEDWRHQG